MFSVCLKFIAEIVQFWSKLQELALCHQNFCRLMTRLHQSSINSCCHCFWRMKASQFPLITAQPHWQFESLDWIAASKCHTMTVFTEAQLHSESQVDWGCIALFDLQLSQLRGFTVLCHDGFHVFTASKSLIITAASCFQSLHQITAHSNSFTSSQLHRWFIAFIEWQLAAINSHQQGFH